MSCENKCSFICEKPICFEQDKATLVCGHLICENCENLYQSLAQKNDFKSLKCPSSNCEKEVFQKCSNYCKNICRIKKLNENLKTLCEICTKKRKLSQNIETDKNNEGFNHNNSEIIIDDQLNNSYIKIDKTTRCSLCGDFLNSHLTHECGQIICKNSILQKITQIIELNESKLLKCPKCLKILDYSFLKETVHENKYLELEYIKKFSNLYPNQLTIIRCPNQNSQEKINVLQNETDIKCFRCSIRYCLICKGACHKNHDGDKLNNLSKVYFSGIMRNNNLLTCHLCNQNKMKPMLEESNDGVFLLCMFHRMALCKFCCNILSISNINSHLETHRKK